MDDLPDITYEVKRLEHQRKSIEITVLDQRAQLADFMGERVGLLERVKELRAGVPSPPADDEEMSDGDRFRALKAVAEYEREILGVEVRLADIDALEQRYDRNIHASDTALKEIDAKLDSLKEAENG